jgi:hypothetical protein
MLRHWQPAMPPDAWRGHFNVGAWAFVLASSCTPTHSSSFFPTVLLHTTAEQR